MHDVVVSGAEARVVMAERALSAPALTERQGLLYMAWAGSDFYLNIASADDGTTFGGKQMIPHRSYRSDVTPDYIGSGSTPAMQVRQVGLAPALAVGPDGLYLAWTGTDSQLHVMRTWLGEGGHSVLSERSGSGPALGIWGNEAVLAWAGTDGRVNLVTVAGAAPAKRTFDESISGAPAMCRVGDDHLLAWSGGDQHLKVMAARGGRFGAPVRLEETSHHAPAVCAYGDRRVLVAWTGTDTRINVMVVGPGDASAPVTFDETSAHALALCRFGPDILLAWTGTDTRLNITRLVAG